MKHNKALSPCGGAGPSALAAALLLAACGGGGGSDTPPPPPVTEPVGIDKALLRQQVEVFLAEQKARIDATDCRQSQTGPCEPLTDIRFSQGQALPTKLRADQTILLIDDGIGHAATLRYRSRMLGYYRLIESSGLVEPHDPVIASTPRWGAELLRAIDGFQYRDAAADHRFGLRPGPRSRAPRHHLLVGAPGPEPLDPPEAAARPDDGARCKLQDPAWHRQQELFRQGWLPADWRWE